MTETKDLAARLTELRTVALEDVDARTKAVREGEALLAAERAAQREAVRVAVGAGCKRLDVATTAGIAEGTLSSWLREAEGEDEPDGQGELIESNTDAGPED